MLQFALILFVHVVQCQTTAQTDVIGFGTGIHGGNNVLQLYNAVKRPVYANAVDFRGFNWSVPLEQSTASTNSSDTWQLQLNYTVVDQPSETIGIQSYSLGFPDGPWDLNNSDWRLCLSISTGHINKRPSESNNDNDGSCAPYLGQSCVDEFLSYYSKSFVSSSGGRYCPNTLSLANIDACNHVETDSTASAGITNTTAPNLLDLGNRTYFDIETNTTVPFSNATFQGLSSGQGFAYEQFSVPSGKDVIPTLLDEARFVRVLSLSMVPTEEAADRLTGGYGWQPNIRLICGRSDATQTGDASAGISGTRKSLVSLLTAISVSTAICYFM